MKRQRGRERERGIDARSALFACSARASGYKRLSSHVWGRGVDIGAADCGVGATTSARVNSA